MSPLPLFEAFRQLLDDMTSLFTHPWALHCQGGILGIN